MSGLAALLAGRVAPGVLRWEAAYDVADVRHAVEHAGWRFGHVDGLANQRRAELLGALGEALALPGWWGRNLDALADSLADLDAEQASRTVLLWDGWGVLAREEPRTFDVVRRLLAGRGMAVLLRGPGPDVDVPLLD